MAATRDQVIIELVAQTKKAVGDIKSLTVGIAAAVAAVKAFEGVARFAFENQKMAAALNQQADAFKNLARSAGADGQQVLEAMQAMAGGTVTQMDLIRSASRASLLGIGFEEMPKLMKISAAAARATGQDLSFLFESITTGIGRTSPLILDNLGITVKLGEVNESYAASLNKTVAELTAAEKKQALLNAVLVQGDQIIQDVGGSLDDLTDIEKWDALVAAVIEFRTELGQGLVPLVSSVASMLTGVSNELTSNLQLIRQDKEDVQLLQDIVDGIVTKWEDVNQVTRIHGQLLVAEGKAEADFLIAMREIESIGQATNEGEAQRLRLATQAQAAAGETLTNIATTLQVLRPVIVSAKEFAAALGEGDGDDGVAASARKVVNGLLDMDAAIIRMAGSGADVGLGAAVGLATDLGIAFEDTGKTLQEATRQIREASDATAGWRDENKSLLSDMMDISGILQEGVLNTFHDIGAAIASGTSATDALGASMTKLLGNILDTLSATMLQAGLLLLPTNLPLGLALIVASGLAAFIGGAVSSSGDSTSDGAPSTAGGDLSKASSTYSAPTGPQQPAGTIIINNIQGSFISERNLAARVASVG